MDAHRDFTKEEGSRQLGVMWAWLAGKCDFATLLATRTRSTVLEGHGFEVLSVRNNILIRVKNYLLLIPWGSLNDYVQTLEGLAL